MKIIFMGTPEFAVPSLEKINKKYGVEAIFTKIDKPNLRGKKITYSPVKEYAIQNNIPIFQPDNIKDKNIVNEIKKIEPDLIVVVAYGKILSQEILDIPKYGVINLHSSLLPKYRGAAPINMAIINGEEKSGVSVMYVEEKLDAGPVLLKEETPITDEDDFLSLHDRLKIIGADLLIEAISKIENGDVSTEVQDETKVSFVKPFKKEDCHIDWTKSSRDIFNKVRGMNPNPTAYSYLDGKLFKIYSVKIFENTYPNHRAGEIVALIKGEGPVVKTGDKSVVIKVAKPENKKKLTGIDLINGNILKIGEVLC